MRNLIDVRSNVSEMKSTGRQTYLLIMRSVYKLSAGTHKNDSYSFKLQDVLGTSLFVDPVAADPTPDRDLKICLDRPERPCVGRAGVTQTLCQGMCVCVCVWKLCLSIHLHMGAGWVRFEVIATHRASREKLSTWESNRHRPYFVDIPKYATNFLKLLRS